MAWITGAVLSSLAVALTLAAISGRLRPADGQSRDSALEIAAASDLRFALEEMVRLFSPPPRADVRLTFGSSGQLAAQIEQGAPFDLFFSANETFVQGLVGKGLVIPRTVHLYAIGRIVLWVRSSSPLAVEAGLPMLLDERTRFVAIANPAHAPYGQAAVEALRTAGLYDRVVRKLVLGENVNQALQFVHTGNADVGMVALSLAVAPPVRPAGRYWLLPDDLHEPIRQAAGVVAGTKREARAGAFLAFVNGPSGRAVMRRFGFSLPGESAVP